MTPLTPPLTADLPADLPSTKRTIGIHYEVFESPTGTKFAEGWSVGAIDLNRDGTGLPAGHLARLLARFYGHNAKTRATAYAAWMNTAATSPQWKKGDKVLLKLGSCHPAANGPPLTVEQLMSDGQVQCSWIDTQTRHSVFSPDYLTPAAKDTPSPTFKVGDVVTSKKGGSAMTVEHIMSNGMICLAWFSSTSVAQYLSASMYNAHDLVLVPA